MDVEIMAFVAIVGSSLKGCIRSLSRYYTPFPLARSREGASRLLIWIPR